ncbi:39S ribosomal protein L18, mitochondrial-like, partial [Gigantopelta aegis]|uniref:39S ribosomal protein L18, mitochondrial-like n=1 Tax=Gigantopelta aegis TaxID=1735272 RepID=UPI001B88B1EE
SEVLPKSIKIQLIYKFYEASLWTSPQTYQQDQGSPNSDVTVSPVFINRNPRNLETLGLARKRDGWPLQSPRKDYYNKVVLKKSHRNTSAWVEHWTGSVVVSASTTEWAIKEHLYSTRDVCAAENIGRVLARRCQECGITRVFHDDAEESDESERLQAFLDAFQEGVTLEEPEQIIPEYQPGIDYDRKNRYAEEKRWKEDYQPD